MPPGFVNRLRSNSMPLNSIPPKTTSAEYDPELAALATRILYHSPLNSPSDLPVYILNSAALPNAKQEYYDRLLPYVLARLPDEEHLIGGLEYEIVFFAGGDPSNKAGPRRRRRASSKNANASDQDEAQEQGEGTTSAWMPQRGKERPGFGWFMRAYNVLSRATRKRLKKLYIVHEKRWVRVLFEMFATVVSPKFRKKVVHVSSLTALAFQIPIENLLIPPSAYYTDRKHVASIDAPYANGKRAFGVKEPLPLSTAEEPRLPRALREATQFLLTGDLIETEGLFRISARQQTVEILRECFDRGQKLIVWKDMKTTMAVPVHREGSGDIFIDDQVLEQIEGYDAHTAAALIKLWYKELKEPIFPQSSYQALGKFYGSPTATFDVDTLKQMLDPGVEYTVLPPLSRQILTLHLLPLLSDVASHSDVNKMTASNLSVCFAPILLCGPDPIEDIKISAIIRKILTAMIEAWSEDLAPALNLTNEKLASFLQTPEDPADREDPLEEDSLRRRNTIGQNYGAMASQVSGIVLADNDDNAISNPVNDDGATSSDVPIESSSSDSDSDDEPLKRPPPLPPRPSATNLHESPFRVDSIGNLPSIPRKPAPPIPVPPRYSTIITDPNALAQANAARRVSPATGPTNTVEVETLSSHRGSVATLPPYEEATPTGITDAMEEAIRSPLSASSVTSIPRKPVGEGKLGRGDGPG